MLDILIIFYFIIMIIIISYNLYYIIKSIKKHIEICHKIKPNNIYYYNGILRDEDMVEYPIEKFQNKFDKKGIEFELVDNTDASKMFTYDGVTSKHSEYVYLYEKIDDKLLVHKIHKGHISLYKEA